MKQDILSGYAVVKHRCMQGVHTNESACHVSLLRETWWVQARDFLKEGVAEAPPDHCFCVLIASTCMGRIGVICIHPPTSRTAPVGIVRFGSTANILAKCMLKYHRISECVGSCLMPHPLWTQSNTFARRASDMWSLGIICYQVLMGELPIPQETADETKIAMLLG